MLTAIWIVLGFYAAAGDPNKGSLTIAAVEAYLDSK